ncbi:major facilitator superfamily MFS_1 [Clostridium botulinum BKT015925]|nr:major facilitator superfamily MFS_1 [Clostridium botulinum BKT015925]
MLLIIRGVQGFFWGFTSTGFGTIAADLIPCEKTGEGLGYYGISSTIAMAIGPSIALIIIKHGSFSKLFNTGLVFGILALISLLFVKYDENINKKAKKNGKINISDFFEKEVFWLASIMFFIAITFGAIISFIIIYGKQIAVTNPGKFFSIYSTILLCIRPFAGKYFDKNGPVKIMALGFVGGILSFTLLFFAKGDILFDLAAICMGIMHGICAPSIIAMAINRVDDTRRGTANATILSAQDLGIGIGPMILGNLSNVIGLAGMYLVCAVIMIIPLVIFYLKETKVYEDLSDVEKVM